MPEILQIYLKKLNPSDLFSRSQNVTKTNQHPLGRKSQLWAGFSWDESEKLCIGSVLLLPSGSTSSAEMWFVWLICERQNVRLIIFAFVLFCFLKSDFSFLNVIHVYRLFPKSTWKINPTRKTSDTSGYILKSARILWNPKTMRIIPLICSLVRREINKSIRSRHFLTSTHLRKINPYKTSMVWGVVSTGRAFSRI